MKIAVCLFNYRHFGGLARDCAKLIRQLQQANHKVDLYTMTTDKKLNDIKMIFIKIYAFTNHKRCYKFAKYIQNNVAKQNYDLIIGFNKMFALDIYFMGDNCFIAKSHKNHSILYRLTSRYRYYKKLEQAVLQNSSCQIFALNKQQLLDFKKYYDLSKHIIHILPPNINKNLARFQFSDTEFQRLRETYRKKLNIKTDTVILLMIGSDFKRKGLDRIFQAMMTISTNNKLFVLGKDDINTWQKMAQDYNLNVEFINGSDDLQSFLYATDIVLHPAYHEAAGMVILDALVAGIPIIVTDICGYASYVKKANSGIVLSEPFSQIQFNQALQKLLQDQKLRKLYSQNAIKYSKVTDLYSCTETMLKIIENNK